MIHIPLTIAILILKNNIPLPPLKGGILVLNPPFDMVYSNPESVIGEWNVAMNTWEGNAERVLNITRQEDKLGAVFTDTKSSDLKISNVEYRDEILNFNSTFPEPAAGIRDVWMKVTDSNLTLDVWAKVADNEFKGALSGGAEEQFDYTIKGQR